VKHVGETTFEVTGDLTVRGVTKPIIVYFDLTGTENDPQGNLRVTFTGRATIDRKDWGVTWNVAAEGGGLLVAYKTTLEFAITAIRRP
jgi:polyisoprenoid-binding protein YceI